MSMCCTYLWIWRILSCIREHTQGGIIYTDVAILIANTNMEISINKGQKLVGIVTCFMTTYRALMYNPTGIKTWLSETQSVVSV